MTMDRPEYGWEGREPSRHSSLSSYLQGFCHVLMFSVIYHFTDPRQHGIDLFYMRKKQKKVLIMTSSMRLSSNKPLKMRG